MKFLPLLKTCIRALVRNPMRAALTIPVSYTHLRAHET